MSQRPEACLILCLSCFKSISLIIVRSQGPRAKLGVPDNLGYRCGGKSLQNRLVALLGRPKRRFWPLQLPTVFRTRFRRPPGSILEPCWPQICSFVDVVFWSRGSSFLNSMSIDFATRALCTLITSAGARKRRIWLATHKNQWIFNIFAFVRRRRPRSKEGNRGENIA